MEDTEKILIFGIFPVARWLMQNRNSFLEMKNIWRRLAVACFHNGFVFPGCIERTTFCERVHFAQGKIQRRFHLGAADNGFVFSNRTRSWLRLTSF